MPAEGVITISRGPGMFESMRRLRPLIFLTFLFASQPPAFFETALADWEVNDGYAGGGTPMAAGGLRIDHALALRGLVCACTRRKVLSRDLPLIAHAA